MTRKSVSAGLAGVCVVTGLLGANAWVRAQGNPQTRQCLHAADETAFDRQRRVEALGTTRAVNTAQAQVSSRGGRTYLPLEALQVRAPSTGFIVRLATDGVSYVFSVKDSLDPCHFAYFSDQDGVIYTAEPIR